MAWREDMGDGTVSRSDVLRDSPPMFESRVLDALSRVHPAVPILIFLPAIVLMAAWSLSEISVLGTAGLVLAAYATGTLVEYWLHRALVPLRPPAGVGG